MFKHILGASAALLIASAPMAMAQSVNAASPGSMTSLLNQLGHATETVTDSYGDPQIKTSLDGVNYDINFYGCSDGKDCRDIQLRASFDTGGRTTEKDLHDWSRDFYIGKAYLNGDGYPVIEHAVVGVDGMSRYTFERILLRWDSALDGFKEHIGF